MNLNRYILGIVILYTSTCAAPAQTIRFGPGDVLPYQSLQKILRVDSRENTRLSDTSRSAQDRLSLPELILDGATIVVDSEQIGEATIATSKLTMRSGARIVTNGADLSIITGVLEVSDAEIVAFAPGHASSDRVELLRSGRSGGTLLLDALKLEIFGSFAVKLDGEVGEPGPPGLPGTVGARGIPGERSFEKSQVIFGTIKIASICRSPGRPGGPGGQGSEGGTGGAGGRGGDGGNLVLRGAPAFHRLAIQFSAVGGPGGSGGVGGPGGPGGSGGAGGAGSSFCPSGPPGPDGPTGPRGKSGADGSKGLFGSIRAVVE